MTQVSRTKQFFYLLYGGGLTQITGVLTTLILARKLPPADFGTYRQVLLVSTILFPIFSAALPNSLLYFLPRLNTNEERSSLVKRTIILLLSLGIISSLIMIFFAHSISKQFNNPLLRQYLILGSLYPAFILGSSFATPFLIAIGQAKTSGLYSSIVGALNLILIILAVSIKTDLYVIIIAYVISSLISFLLALYLAQRILQTFTQKWLQSVSLREQFSFAIPLGLATIVSVWGLKLDQAVVSSYFSVEKYAIYSIGAIELPLVGLIGSSIYSVLFPEIAKLMSEGNKEEALRLWQRTIEKSMLLIMPLFGVGMILSYPLITTLYSTKYAASVPIFQIYLFLVPLRSISYGLLLRSVGKTKYDFYGSFLFLFTNMALAISSISILEIYGPPIAMVVAVYLLAAYLVYNTKREIGFKIGEILNFKAIATIMMITLLPIAALWLANSSLSFKSISNGLILFIVYLAIVGASYKIFGQWKKLHLNIVWKFGWILQ